MGLKSSGHRVNPDGQATSLDMLGWSAPSGLLGLRHLDEAVSLKNQPE
jgi:hypothetical protein